MGERPVVVVGVDGSAGSRAAVGYALDDAARRGARVRVITVFEEPRVLGGGLRDVGTGSVGARSPPEWRRRRSTWSTRCVPDEPGAPTSRPTSRR